jgi:Trk-type K+ transport system membrane component
MELQRSSFAEIVIECELLDRARRYAREILSSYSRHAGSQLSAAIAYRLLFSLVPFAALLLTILDAVLEPSQREQFVQWLFGVVPGSGSCGVSSGTPAAPCSCTRASRSRSSETRGPRAPRKQAPRLGSQSRGWGRGRQ